ncbi:MAG: CHASE3 domain-containing protein [Betaproteobacteria bacterium]
MVRVFDGNPWFVPRGVAVLFAGALLAVILDAFLFSYVIDSVEDNARTIQAARLQIDQLVAAKDLLQDAETGQRGYLLTGREEYLEPYVAATRNVDSVVAKVISARDASAAEGGQLGEFRRLVKVKLDELDRTIELYRQGSRTEALSLVQSDAGKATMDHLRTLIESRQNQVQDSQNQARAKRAQIFRWGLIVNVVMAVIAASLLLGFALTIARHLMRRQEFERHLQLTNVELERAVADRTEELAKLSHHLLTVREEEKSSLARELHDGLGSSLTAARMDLAAARSRRSTAAEVRAALDAALLALDTAIEQQRSALQGLHPRLLDTMGFRAALEHYVADFSRRTGVASEIHFAADSERLDEARGIALFRIAQEALTNITKHAGAKTVKIALARNTDTLTLTVDDDGEGMDVGATAPKSSLGLISMRERARQFRGDCSVGPAPSGRGTRVVANLRLDGPAVADGPATGSA